MVAAVVTYTRRGLSPQVYSAIGREISGAASGVAPGTGGSGTPGELR